LIAIERHGEVPEVKCLKNEEEELRYIEKLIADFQISEYNSLGIICKTQKQADQLNEA
jgi:DNA helicase-2/ATP-dependent DNA helicase PcrA